MNGATPNAVVKIAPELPVPVKVLAGAGFLRLDPGRGHKELVCGQSPRVLWIDTPGGYRVAVNGGAGLAEVFGLFKDL